MEMTCREKGFLGPGNGKGQCLYENIMKQEYFGNFNIFLNKLLFIVQESKK